MNTHAQAFVWTCVFIPLGHILRSIIAGSCGNPVFNHLRNCQRLHHFASPPTVYEGSSFSTSSPILVIICLFDYSLCGCEVASHCGFDLHFPNG